MNTIQFSPKAALLGAVGLALFLVALAAFQSPTAGSPVQTPKKQRPIGALPFTITECGSYVLTDCLVGVAGKSGITINSDDVSFYLNGYTVLGTPGSISGIAVVGPRSNIRIFGGAVRDWGQQGVAAGIASGILVRDLEVSNNGLSGIVVGDGSRVSECVTTNNGTATFAEGIETGVGCVVANCVAVGNSQMGISVGYGSMVIDCSATSNANTGIYTSSGDLTVLRNTATQNGIGIQVSGLVSDCTVADNLFGGIEALFASTISNNKCTRNGGAGIRVPLGMHSCRIEGNNVVLNDLGISVQGNNNLIVRNSARLNTTANYQFAPSNNYGAIVVSPGAAFASTDPWQNFEY